MFTRVLVLAMDDLVTRGSKMSTFLHIVRTCPHMQAQAQSMWSLFNEGLRPVMISWSDLSVLQLRARGEAWLMWISW